MSTDKTDNVSPTLVVAKSSIVMFVTLFKPNLKIIFLGTNDFPVGLDLPEPHKLLVVTVKHFLVLTLFAGDRDEHLIDHVSQPI